MLINKHIANVLSQSDDPEVIANDFDAYVANTFSTIIDYIVFKHRRC